MRLVKQIKPEITWYGITEKTGDDKPIEVKIGWVALVDFKLYKQKREIEEQIVKVLNKYIKNAMTKRKKEKTMKCPNCRDKTQRINELTEERNNLRKYIRVMLASAGIPDKDKALRTVIQWGKEALDIDKKMHDE
jgi:hypothetical protein